MTETQHNDFHARIRVLEEWRMETRDLLHQLVGKIDSLTAIVAKRPECPQPGACLEIRSEVEELRQEHKDTMARVLKLEKWQTFLTGAAVSMGILWAVVKVVLPYFIK